MLLYVPHVTSKAACIVLSALLIMLVIPCSVFCDAACSATPNAGPSTKNNSKDYRATHLPWAAIDNPELVAKLIKNGQDVNATDEDGRTALHFAVFYNHYGTAKLLLDNGANVNVREHSSEPGFCGWGWYPLHLALRNENGDMVRLLIDHGADVNAARSDKWTPIFTAAYHGQPDMVALLISKGANVTVLDSEPLRMAISQGKLEAAKILIEHGANVNGRGGKGETPLEIASQADISAVELLIANKAKIDLADNDGKTPLFQAAYSGNLDIVKLLVSNGANVNARTKTNMSILQAVRAGKAAYIASIHKPNGQVKHDWHRIRRVLLRHGAKE